jgi:hypothetical protein
VFRGGSGFLLNKTPSPSPNFTTFQARYKGPTFKSFKPDFDFFKKGCPGWGANPGLLNFIYFLIFTTLPLSHIGSPDFEF